MGRRLGLPFLDSDIVIEQRLGCSIREFFDREGEERFRDIEQSVIDDLSKHHHGILSTGGGSVLREANRQNLRTRGKVVYLRSTPEEVFRRVRHDKARPLLQVDDPMARLRALFEARLNFFASQMGVQWRKLSLSNAGSRWGSARIDGAIRLNWRLIHLKPDAIDYVVVHELAHLREMNHSPAFWKVVAEILPDHVERRKALQKENLANWA